MSFSATDTEKSFTFTATDDRDDDDGESVELTFGTLPSGVSTGATTKTTVTITDDDMEAGKVTLTLMPSTIDESGSDNVSTVTVSLGSTSTAATTVTVSTAPASAAWFTLSANRTLTIAAGQTTGTGAVTITAVDNSTYTGNRQVTVSGSATNETGVTDPDDVTLTITEDDDKPVTASFGQDSYTVAEGSTATVKVTLSADPEREVVVPLTKSNQNGATGSDYSGVPASVSFQGGETERTFTFVATQDTEDDDGERVSLSFGSPPAMGVTAGTHSQTVVTIRDDDDPQVVVSFSQGAYTVSEGATTTVTVSLDKDPERTVTIPITTANLGGASDSDYSGVPESLTFARGVTERSFVFSAVRDNLSDAGEWG